MSHLRSLIYYIILGCLHAKYLGERKRLPPRPLTDPTREDGIFAALRRAVSKPQTQDSRKNAWISEATWRLDEERVSTRRDPAKDQYLSRIFGRAIVASLKGDRRRREEEAVAEVKTLLGSDPPLHREAWHRLKGWYWDAVDRATLSAQVTLEWIMAEQVYLYSYVTPPGENIPIYVESLPVDDSVPTEGNIEWAVKRLQNHRSEGSSRMRAEHLKGWLAAARNKDKEEAAAEQDNPTEGRKLSGPDRAGR